jgi:hypothetical protein
MYRLHLFAIHTRADTHVLLLTSATHGLTPRPDARLHINRRVAPTVSCDFAAQCSHLQQDKTSVPLDNLLCLSSPGPDRDTLMAGIVRLCMYGSQTATSKFINTPCASGIASLVMGLRTGGSAESTDPWQNSLSSYHQSLALLLNLSSRSFTQITNLILAPTSLTFVQRRADGRLFSDGFPKQTR